MQLTSKTESIDGKTIDSPKSQQTRAEIFRTPTMTTNYRLPKQHAHVKANCITLLAKLLWPQDRLSNLAVV